MNLFYNVKGMFINKTIFKYNYNKARGLNENEINKIYI